MNVQIIVRRFGTNYRPDPKNPAQMKDHDWVRYSPLGSVQKTEIFKYIFELQPVPIEGNLKAEQSPVVKQSHLLWDVIKPQYEAWKQGRKATVDGTPLAAWPYVSEDLAELLRIKGVQTVEQMAQLTDTHKQSMGIPGLHDMIENARRFVLSLDKSQVTNALAQKDSEIADLKARMEELAAMVIASKKEETKSGAGRPRKEETDAQQVG